MIFLKEEVCLKMAVEYEKWSKQAKIGAWVQGQYQWQINCCCLKCSWLYSVTHPLFGLRLSECLQYCKRAIRCHLKHPKDIPNNRLVTFQTRKGHRQEKHVMTRFQVFSSFWNKCPGQDTKACSRCSWCPVPGWGPCVNISFLNVW